MTGTTSRIPAFLLAASLALLAVGCGTVSAGHAGSATSDAPALAKVGNLEKTTLNVAVVPAMDSAGFFVALHEGLFAREGLTIHYSPATSSETVIKDQVGGQYDITGGNYVSYIQAQVGGTANLQIVAEGSVMQQGTQVILTLARSHIRTLTQLKGHMLGVNAPNNINYLLDASVLTENGISPRSVEFPAKPIPFPLMGAALQSGVVAAATVPEPFASLMEEKFGAVTLADLNQGATQQFPIQGYVTTKAWARAHPNTVKAFVAALEAGQEIADTSRAAVEAAFESLASPQTGKVTPLIASMVALNIYPLAIDRTRLQRVANVMLQFGLLRHSFNVDSMIR